MTGSGAFSAGDARALGDAAARVAVALADVDHPGTARTTQWNLRIGGEVVEVLLPFVTDAHRRERVAQAAATALAGLDGIRDRLRTQTTHGDVVDDNVVRRADGAITGVIDFGDVAESWTVGELAVACVAILHHTPRRPLVVLDAIAAFDAVLPLDDDEVHALWPLVQLRSAVLVASGEQQVALDAADGGNGYADENRRHEWRAFETATALDAATHGDADPLAAGASVRGVHADRGVCRSRRRGGRGSLDDQCSPRFRGMARAGRRGAPARARPATSTARPSPHGARHVSRAPSCGRRARWRRSLSASRSPACPAPPSIAPASGVVRHVDDAVVLATDEYELWLTGLEAPAAEGGVAAGARLGVIAGHDRIRRAGRRAVVVGGRIQRRAPTVLRRAIAGRGLEADLPRSVRAARACRRAPSPSRPRRCSPSATRASRPCRSTTTPIRRGSSAGGASTSSTPMARRTSTWSTTWRRPATGTPGWSRRSRGSGRG